MKKSSVLVAGIGGLGSTVSILLTRLGIGKLHLVDPKDVDEPDLNRQLLYDREDIGKKKVDVAYKKLKAIRDDLVVESHPVSIDESFELPDVDVVVDCLDNFKARYVLEDKAWKNGVPFVHAGVKEYYAQVTTIMPKKTKRLADVIGDVDDEGGVFQVFPPLVTLVASIEVSEVVKVLCYPENSLFGNLLLVDIFELSFDKVFTV